MRDRFLSSKQVPSCVKRCQSLKHLCVSHLTSMHLHFRSYKKLAEVVQKKKEEKRQEDYALNRLKAKVFNRVGTLRSLRVSCFFKSFILILSHGFITYCINCKCQLHVYIVFFLFQRIQNHVLKKSSTFR